MIAVYALSNPDCENDIYIGSSKNIKTRMIRHKESCNNVKSKGYKYKVYSFIRDNGGWKKWKYHIIEEFDVYDKIKLKEREDYWMVELKSSLNSCRVNRSPKEYKKYYVEKNREEIRRKDKIYREENKARLSTQNWCECGGKYITGHRHRHFKSKRCRNYLASITL